MKLKRNVALIAILATLFAGTVTPKPARAVSTTALILGSIAAYVTFVVIGAYLVFGRDRPQPALMPDAIGPDQAWDQQGESVRFVHRCPQNSANLSLVCW